MREHEIREHEDVPMTHLTDEQKAELRHQVETWKPFTPTAGVTWGQIGALLDEIEALKRERDANAEDMEHFESELLASQERELRLREALKFYSESKNFNGVYRDDQGEIIEEVEDIGGDVSEHPKNGPMQEFGMLAEETLNSSPEPELAKTLRGVRDLLKVYAEESADPFYENGRRALALLAPFVKGER